MDEPLQLTQRLQLRIHILACTMCSRYLAQIRLVRDGVRTMAEPNEGTTDSPHLSTEAKDRIRKSLD